MMASNDENVQKLERALIENYRARPEPQVERARLTQNVMRDIRQATGDSGWWSPSVALDQLVWRTATIAASVVLVVTVFTVAVVRTTAGESGVSLAEEFDSTPLLGE